MASALLGMLALSLGASTRRRGRETSRRTEPAIVHAIDVLWWFCDYEDYEHRAKSNSNITSHKAGKHNIGVKWKECPDCDDKAKTNAHLNGHIKHMHTSKRDPSSEQRREESDAERTEGGPKDVLTLTIACYKKSK